MRSAEAHALLVERDPALPWLAVLLEDARLGECLGVPVTRTYLRYKPATSAVALLDVGGRPAIAHAWGSAAPDKRLKALRHVTPDDVLLDRPDAGLLVVDAMTDRRLPALRRLVRSGRVGAWLGRHGVDVAPDAPPTTLAHKPSRRWVGRVPLSPPGGHVVLRAYGRREYPSALVAHERLDPMRVESVRLPRVLATHHRGLIALEHLPGETLDTRASAGLLERLGAGLGELHAGNPGTPGTPSPRVGPTALEALTPALGGLGRDARDIAVTATRSLRPGAGAVVHGDFSLDQVVAEGDDLGIIDLDRTRAGNPLDDVAGLLAAAALTALPGGGVSDALRLVERLRDPLLAGHRATWSAGCTDDLAPRIALELLARAEEPFRTGTRDWPDVTRDLVTLAGVLVGEEVA